MLEVAEGLLFSLLKARADDVVLSIGEQSVWVDVAPVVTIAIVCQPEIQPAHQTNAKDNANYSEEY